MTVKDLIERLSHLPPDATVLAFDADSEELEPVTGLTFDETEVYIQTDDNS